MNRKKTITAFVAAAATVALTPAGAAFAFGGAMGAGGLSGLSVRGFAVNPSGNLGSGDVGLNALSVGHYGALPIAGRVTAGSTLPDGARLVQLRVNGKIISMALDTGVADAELSANPTNDYNKELYNSVLRKQLVVIGNAELRDRITTAADSSKPLVLNGYVFDSTSPYFVVRSASNGD